MLHNVTGHTNSEKVVADTCHQLKIFFWKSQIKLFQEHTQKKRISKKVSSIGLDINLSIVFLILKKLLSVTSCLSKVINLS